MMGVGMVKRQGVEDMQDCQPFFRVLRGIRRRQMLEPEAAALGSTPMIWGSGYGDLGYGVVAHKFAVMGRTTASWSLAESSSDADGASKKARLETEARRRLNLGIIESLQASMSCRQHQSLAAALFLCEHLLREHRVKCLAWDSTYCCGWHCDCRRPLADRTCLRRKQRCSSETLCTRAKSGKTVDPFSNFR